MKKVIVTGATGMIGASMIEQMVADGIEVTAVIRPNSPKRSNLIEHENIKMPTFSSFLYSTFYGKL